MNQTAMYLYKTEPDIQNFSDRELIERLFLFLNYTEESDNGRIFHPTVISSCRAMMTEPLNQLLEEMKSRALSPNG